MTPTTSSPRLSRIFLMSLFASLITATHASTLFPRQAETCGGFADLQQCGSDLPSSFCCPKDSTCMALNSGDVQSAICCPIGSDCGFIHPTTCDITQLNATLYPANQMHISETDGIELPKCGDKCCTLGYICHEEMCVLDRSPWQTPSPTSSATSSATSSPTSSPTSSANATPSPTSPASASQTSSCSEITPIETKQGFDGKSFAAGLLPGIVIGALSTLGLIWILNKRREHQSKERYSGDFGHVARQISDPIYDPQLAARTDFMRRGSHSAYSSPNSTDRIVRGMKETNTNPPIHGFTPRIKSMWDRTPKLNFGFTSGLPSNPAPPVRAGNPYTNPYQTPLPKPKRIHSASRRTSSLRTSDQTFNTLRTGQHRSSGERSGSSETIDVLMPTPSFLAPPQAPGMQRDNRYTTDSANTTFTRLMERAGFDESALQEVKDWRTPKV